MKKSNSINSTKVNNIANTVKKIKNQLNYRTYMRGGAKCQKGGSMVGGNSNITGGGDSNNNVGICWISVLTLIVLVILVLMLGYLIYQNMFSNNVSSIPIPNSTMRNNKKNKEGMMDIVDADGKVININIRNDNPEYPNANMISYPEYVVEKSYERLVNPLLPPERSYELSYGVPINVPSRGYVGGYQQLGAITRVGDSGDATATNDRNSLLPLFGRPLYNGSKKWTYYTTSENRAMIKLQISVNGRKCNEDFGCDELYDGDIVDIKELGGQYKVSIYDYDKPRYIPFAF